MNQKRFALITGCGEGGIGHALARHFHSRGLEVIATLLPHESKDHLAADGYHAFASDVTSDEQAATLLAAVTKITGGRLDVLVNCAGIVYTMTAVDTEVKEVEKMFAVNVFGPMRMVHYFHRLLIQAKGVIVNIGSVGGVTPYVYGAAYNATKAALHHWGNTVRVEMKPFGVRVVNVISGEVGTNILKRDANRALPEGSVYEPLGDHFQAHVRRTPKTSTPDEYAAGVVAEVLKPHPSAWFWHGAQTFTVRWVDALLPKTFWDWLFWNMFELGKLKQ